MCIYQLQNMSRDQNRQLSRICVPRHSPSHCSLFRSIRACTSMCLALCSFLFRYTRMGCCWLCLSMPNYYSLYQCSQFRMCMCLGQYMRHSRSILRHLMQDFHHMTKFHTMLQCTQKHIHRFVETCKSHGHCRRQEHCMQYPHMPKGYTGLRYIQNGTRIDLVRCNSHVHYKPLDLFVVYQSRLNIGTIRH